MTDYGDKGAGGFAFKMLLIYTVSFLLHIPERIPALAVIRPDLILLSLLAFSLISQDWKKITVTKPGRLLLILCIWIILTIPFVEWPGSVLRENWKPFLKAVIFFFAIVLTIQDRQRLKTFLVVLLACQLLRIVEPLYMHITDGYWGDHAYLSGGEFMNRLSGHGFIPLLMVSLCATAMAVPAEPAPIRATAGLIILVCNTNFWKRYYIVCW